MLKFRNVAFTSFEVDPPEFKKDHYRYMIYGKETCPDTGRLHWQGYCQLACQMTANQFKKTIGIGVHFESARGTLAENRAYCVKDGDFLEFGEPKQQGERNDLNVVNNCIINDNFSLSDVAMKYPNQFVKYHGGFNKLIEMREKKMGKEMRDIEVYVLVGPAGCGKTRFVYENCPNLYDLICERDQTLWFDGYEGEEVLLLDEFRGGTDISVLLRLLDRYPMRLRVKGGHTYARWNKVYITSNLLPRSWYNGDLSPLLRRITELKNFYDTDSPKEISEVD